MLDCWDSYVANNCPALKGGAIVINQRLALAKLFKPILANKFLVFLFKGFLLMMSYLVVYISPYRI